MTKLFTADEIRAIADALADTNEGMTGSEIGHFLQVCKMNDPDPAITKRHRLYNALVTSQNQRKDRRAILAFIRYSMKPARFAREPHRYEPLRANLNRALAFCGLAMQESGELVSADKAKTLNEAQRRANDLRTDLELRKIHKDILVFCREELLKENYFHAVLEATKSIANKIRSRTGLTDDGALLVDRALGGDLPMLAVNALATDAEKSEQRGFLNIVKGAFGMFRNPTAHAPKIVWAVNKEDAEEVFTILSLIHKRIDAAYMPNRAQ